MYAIGSHWMQGLYLTKRIQSCKKIRNKSKNDKNAKEQYVIKFFKNVRKNKHIEQSYHNIWIIDALRNEKSHIIVDADEKEFTIWDMEKHINERIKTYGFKISDYWTRIVDLIEDISYILVLEDTLFVENSLNLFLWFLKRIVEVWYKTYDIEELNHWFRVSMYLSVCMEDWTYRNFDYVNSEADALLEKNTKCDMAKILCFLTYE